MYDMPHTPTDGTNSLTATCICLQVALAQRLSEIMAQVPPAVGDLYFRTFIKTMRREWFGIDRLRLDKFMMLVRKFYTQHLRQLQAANWCAAGLPCSTPPARTS